MALRTSLIILFVWCLSSHNEVQGRIFSMENDLELKNQLKILNKPSVKTIQTIYGDAYECINFYQQPAFDHPLLKNQTFNQTEYIYYRKENGFEDSSFVHEMSSIWQNGEGCPIGTVPIKKITEDDLIRARFQHSVAFSLQNGDAQTHFAIVRTVVDPRKKYKGAGMVTSLYNPKVQDSQYSSSRMKIQNGVDSIEVGWTVNPSLYKDSRTRLYVNTNVGQTHCFNAFCPGFVVLNPRMPIDLAFNDISQRGGPIYDKKISIRRDPANGNWVLRLTPGDTAIGYWPSNIMGGLSDFATYIDWGGEVSSPSNAPVLPEMGTGFQPLAEATDKDAFCMQITSVDENNQVVNADGTETSNDFSKFYAVKDEGNRGGDFQHLLFFGGPRS